MKYLNEILNQKLKNLPNNSGVYVMRDISGNIIYVGKAKNLKNRISQYFNKKNTSNSYSFKVKAMVDKIYDLDYFITLNEIDALALENNLIKKYQPFYNILLKDGKSFPYIKLNQQKKYPYLEVVRKVINDGAKYFGPYISGISPYEILNIITTAFPIRTCSLTIDDKKKYNRECLNYSLGICSAPCTHKITEEEYQKIIEKVIDFLNGNDHEVEKILKDKMQKEATLENFEQALILRERLKMISRLKDKVVAEVPKNLDIDVFAYSTNNISGAISFVIVRGGKILGIQNVATIDASLEDADILLSFIYQYYQNAKIPDLILVSHDINDSNNIKEYLINIKGKNVEIKTAQKGYKKKLIDMATQNANEYLTRANIQEKNKYEKTLGALQNLKLHLHLKNTPKRIECYDISNTQGSNSVGSMVVFINGEKATKHYRKFKIKTIIGPNDFESLKEVINRRLAELDKGVDESFSQKPDLIVIDGGKGQLSKTSTLLFEHRKDIEIISLAKKFEEVYKPNQSMPIMLKRGSVELKLLQNIRDEAHRFAITFHRNLRQKHSLSSPLDNIKGIGKVKKNELIKHFKTIDQIKKAKPEELMLVKGIDPVLAQKIYNYFNQN